MVIAISSVGFAPLVGRTVCGEQARVARILRQLAAKWPAPRRRHAGLPVVHRDRHRPPRVDGQGNLFRGTSDVGRTATPAIADHIYEAARRERRLVLPGRLRESRGGCPGWPRRLCAHHGPPDAPMSPRSWSPDDHRSTIAAELIALLEDFATARLPRVRALHLPRPETLDSRRGEFCAPSSGRHAGPAFVLLGDTWAQLRASDSSAASPASTRCSWPAATRGDVAGRRWAWRRSTR